MYEQRALVLAYWMHKIHPDFGVKIKMGGVGWWSFEFLVLWKGVGCFKKGRISGQELSGWI